LVPPDPPQAVKRLKAANASVKGRVLNMRSIVFSGRDFSGKQTNRMHTS
jgi:hypothetical protein